MYKHRRVKIMLAVALLIALIQPVWASELLSGGRITYETGRNETTGGHVVREGNRLYVGAYGLGMRIFDISEPTNPQQIGEYFPATIDEGDADGDGDVVRADAVPDAAVFVDENGKDRHIAVLNGTRRVTRPDGSRTDRSEFLDVTDPANPVLLHTFVGQADGEAHNGDIVDERRLWLPSGGSGDNGLRIYDMNPLLQATPDAPALLFRGNPVTLWESSPYRGDKPVGNSFTHTHDKTIYLDYPVKQPDGSVAQRDILLLAEGGSYLDEAGNSGSVFIIDITDPRNPVVLLRWLHQTGPDHHPIRYHHEAQFLDGDRHVMLVTDEDLHNGCGGAGGVTAVRISDDLTSATELSEWFIPEGTPAPICSVHVFSSLGNLVFLGSYNAGLQVVDYKNPAQPQQAAHHIAAGSTAWGALIHKVQRDCYVYVGDMSRGLDVFKFENDSNCKNG